MRAPSRREIGHGALAERALEAILPNHEDFPYTIRVVSDILESNGSSSMATVCGASLSLMDAGVKIRSPVAGIAMGLIKEKEKVCILSDILGSEDRHGDMDFKVAGTKDGVTALQMDLKTQGIDLELIREAFLKAKEGRLYILQRMNEVISQPRKTLSPYAPKLIKFTIDPEKVGLLIGPGGKTVRDIQNRSGAMLEISDEGVVTIYSESMQAVEDAKAMVQAITDELRLGRIYKARVNSTKEFGAFVEIIPSGHEGLLHISELAEGFVRRTEDIVKVGDQIYVKLISFDDLGRPRFSLKQARQFTGG
jgi:polyribonucleotide nucleotidyltransferase